MSWLQVTWALIVGEKQHYIVGAPLSRLTLLKEMEDIAREPQ
jgi:hypothetical protein